MRKWWPLVAVCLGTFVFLLDTTVLSVALPRIGERLSASPAELEWVVNVYTLVLAVLMLTAGALADRYGARTVYVAGLAVFGLASLACGLAPGAGWLIAGRAAQGVGGAAIGVCTFALLGVYRGPDFGRAMGVFAAVTALGAAAGPALGGVLTQCLDWRAVFLLNVPLVALTAALALRIPGDGARRPAVRVDPAGTVAFALCAGCLTHALTLAGEDGLSSPWVAVLLVTAAVALAVFVRVERARGAAALLDVRLFARASFSAVMGCVVASTAAFATLVYTSMWLQSGPAPGPVRAGLALMPLAVAACVTSLVAGRRLHGRSPRAVLGTGLLLSGLGCALQAGLDAGSTAVSVAAGLAVTGVGVGLTGPVMGAAVLAALPPERAGTAAGAMTTFRQLGQTVGVAAFGVLFRHGAPAPYAGLDRVLLAAAAVGAVGAALAYVWGPRAAGRTGAGSARAAR
ncbi:MFS transporter [Streptomyces sp. I05A-00742]|uniref:MFS transporter n=1 Tax=Streptomyces sp. I05A-00742 TaxID=2732853 RepID=UPI001489C535|nr:MFS transporter [Streptomyces sp. I05A-00742]